MNPTRNSEQVRGLDIFEGLALAGIKRSEPSSLTGNIQHQMSAIRTKRATAILLSKDQPKRILNK